MGRQHASQPQQIRRRLGVSLSIALLALVFSACGPGQGAANTPRATTSPTPTPILAPTLAQQTVYTADFLGWVYAFNARDGSPRWKVSAATMFGSPAVSAGVVYVVDRGGQVNE